MRGTTHATQNGPRLEMGRKVGLSLSQAAKRVGKSKSTIGRAIESGRLSATRNEDGTFSIDPSELFRVFPQGGPGTDASGVDEPTRNPKIGTGGTGAEPDEIKALRAELTKEGQRAADAEKLAAVAVAEKRAAEALAEERARALDAAERNLADLRRMLPPPSSLAPSPAADPARPWWRRIF